MRVGYASRYGLPLRQPSLMEGSTCICTRSAGAGGSPQFPFVEGRWTEKRPAKFQYLQTDLSASHPAAVYFLTSTPEGYRDQFSGQTLSAFLQRLNRRSQKLSSSTRGRRRGGCAMASATEAVEWQAEEATTSGRSRLQDNGGFQDKPDHLILLVNGIFASANDWSYVAGELTKRLGPRALVHASNANSYFQTFQGIDVSGKRLAEEVREVSRKRPSLKRITVVGHSLGGLIARYAIGKLYEEAEGTEGRAGRQGQSQGRRGTLAGLEPISFITLATPHLGVRGNKQLPFLLGLDILESLAPPFAPLLVGRSGRQLFLSDENPAKGKRPLLLRMAADGPDGNFVSALRAFQLRSLYANVGYDHMVGWRTSCVRREAELPKVPKKSLSQRYKHVVLVEEAPARPHPAASSAELANTMRDATQTGSANEKAAKYHDVLEEEMIGGLQTVSWRRVDVSFREALWPFFAHNNIHVKLRWLHHGGVGVIAHLADTLLQMEPEVMPSARL